MNNSKKLLALLMALAMLVTFAVPTFAAGETPETVTLKFEYEGYEPTSDDVVLINGAFNSSKKNDDGALTEGVIDKGYDKLEIKFMKIQGMDMEIEVSLDSGKSITLDSTTPNGRKDIGNSQFYFSKNQSYEKEPYLKIGNGSYNINDNLTFKVKYTDTPIVDFILIGGNEYTRKNVIDKVKIKKNLSTSGKSYLNDNVELYIQYQTGYYHLAKIYSNGRYLKETSSSSNTDGKSSYNFKVIGPTIVIMTTVKEGSGEEPLDFNFFNVKNGSIGLPGKDNYEFTVGESLDPNNFIANLTDKGMATGKFDKAIIDQVGFRYQISKNPVAFKLENDDKVTLDASVAGSTKYPGFYDKDTEIKFTVAEQTDKIAKVYLTKAGVKDENPLAAEGDGSYKFNINADTKIRVKYEDKESEPSTKDTANAKVEELNLAARNAGGDADWEELKEVKTLELVDSGKILRLVDRNGKEVVSQRIQVNPEPPLDYPVTVKSNIKDKVITITPSSNGVRNKANYQEDTDVTFTVPDHNLVKTIKFKSGDKEKVISRKTNSNQYTETVTGDTVFEVVYYQSFKVDVEKVIDGSINDNTSYGGVTFVGEQITKAQEDSTVKFSAKDIDGKRVKSVKVNGEEPAKDGDNYSFTIKEDTTITVEYVTQYQLKVNSNLEDGGIKLVDDAEATLPKKFDKDTKVKFEVKGVEDKVIYSVKVGEDTLTAKDGVYEVTLDRDKTVELKYVDDPLLTAKEEAKAKIQELENLSKEEKEAAEAAVNKATDEAGVKAALEDAKKLEEKNKAAKEAAEALKKAKEEADKAIDDLGNLDKNEKNAAKEEVKKANSPEEVKKALEDAKQKDAEIKAKKEAEEKLNTEKEALNKQIDELQDEAVKKELKDKVANATTDNIDQVKAEVEDEIQKQKDKENFDDRKNELKEEIENSDLDAETKKNLTDKVDALEDSSGLDDIRQEFANAKELKTAKDEAKKEIGELGYLSPEEKAAAEKAIADATDKDGVEKAVANAEELNEKHQKEAEAEKALKEAKDQAKDTIGKLENLNDDEKTDALNKVDQAKNKDEIDKAVADAKAQDDKNKEEAEAKKELKDAKEAAKKDIDDLENLNDDEKKAAQAKVDEADSKEAVEKALEAAQAQNKANADKKAVEEAKAEADKAQAAADEEKAKAEEAEKKAADAEKAAEDAQAEADAKAKKAEDAKAAADEAAEKAKEAKDAADKAKEAADADPENEDLKQAAEEAKKEADAAEDAQKKAKEEADTKDNEAKEAQNKADEAKKEAEDAKKTAEEAKAAADKAQAEADEKAKEAKDLEDKLAPTDDEKDEAKKAIDDLDNLSPEEKKEFKDAVDNATTKAEVDAAVEAARAKDEENKNKPQPEP